MRRATRTMTTSGTFPRACCPRGCSTTPRKTMRRPGPSPRRRRGNLRHRHRHRGWTRAGEDDESALDATVPKVSPVPDLSFTSFTSAPTRYGDRETRAEVASRAATRLPVGRPPGIRIQPKCACGTGGLVFHPRAENGSLTDCPISPRPPPRSQANTWSSSPPGGAKSPGATAPRIPAPRDPVRRRPRPRRPRPSFFFPCLLFICHGHPSAISIESSPIARRGDARPRPTPTQETPGDPPRGLITNRAIERDRRIRLRAPVEPCARASAPRGGVPWVPSLSQTRRRAPTVPPTGKKISKKIHPSPPPRRPNLSSPSSSPDPKPRARRAPRLPPGRRRPPRSVVRPVAGDGPIVEAGLRARRIGLRRPMVDVRHRSTGVAAARDNLHTHASPPTTRWHSPTPLRAVEGTDRLQPHDAHQRDGAASVSAASAPSPARITQEDIAYARLGGGGYPNGGTSRRNETPRRRR